MGRRRGQDGGDTRAAILLVLTVTFLIPIAGMPARGLQQSTQLKADNSATATATSDADVDYRTSTSVYTPATHPVGGTNIGNSCDDCTTQITFPFPVRVYGESYTSAYVSSNGNVQFTGNSNSASNGCLPNANFGAAIMPFQADLRTNGLVGGVPGAILVGTNGVAPNRMFSIYWLTNYFVSSDEARFGVWFHENSGRIDVGYDKHSNRTAEAVTGVQASASGPSTEYACHLPFDPTVGALVSYIPTRQLTIDKTGTGSGTVNSAPAGISCGATCSAQFDEGTPIVLTAGSNPGSGFAGWSGGGCSGTGSCGVTLNTATTVTATFLLECPGFEGDPRSQVVGTPGDNMLVGTAGNNIMCGLGGKDKLLGKGGKDMLLGGGGRDVARGGAANDRMLGGGRGDRLIGELGRDFAHGGSGRDFCRAEERRSCES